MLHYYGRAAPWRPAISDTSAVFAVTAATAGTVLAVGDSPPPSLVVRDGLHPEESGGHFVEIPPDRPQAKGVETPMMSMASLEPIVFYFAVSGLLVAGSALVWAVVSVYARKTIAGVP